MAKFIVQFQGEVEVEAGSEEEAEKLAWEVLKENPGPHLFWSALEIYSCRFCGCTDHDACVEGCGWLNSAMDVCTNPMCLTKYKLEQLAALSVAEAGA